MAITLEDNYKTTLSKKVEPADTTITVATAPTTATAGSLYIVRGSVQEWMSFTGVSGTTLTGVTRALSKTTDSTAQSWVGGTNIIITIMSRQLVDKLEPTQIIQEAKTYATTAARDAALGADGAALFNYVDIKCTDTGLFYKYNTSTNVWEVQGNGVATGNASTTAAGSIELPTDAEVTAKTATGGTGATICPTNAQTGKSVALKAVDTTLDDTDHIVFDNAGTDNKMLVSVLRDQLAGDKTKKGTFEMLTDAEATTATDETRVPNVKQMNDNYEVVYPGTSVTYFSDGGGNTSSLTYETLATYTATANGTYRVQYDGSHGDNFTGKVRVTVDSIPVGGKGNAAFWGSLYDEYSASDSSTLIGEVALGTGQVIDFDGLTSDITKTTTIANITIKGNK